MDHEKYVELGNAEKERRRLATLAVKSLLEEWIKEKGDQERCPICGEDNPKTFQKHHMDGDHSNNEEGNIVPICSNCHTLTYRAKDQLKELWEKRHEKWSNLKDGARKAWETRRSGEV